MTIWSRVFERMIVIQIIKRLPTHYGSQRFIPMFTRANQTLLT